MVNNLENISDEEFNQLQEKIEDLFTSGKYEQVMPDFDKIIGHVVDEIEHCGWRAHGLLKDGKKDEAIEFHKKITQLEPVLFKYREQKAIALENLGRVTEAKSLREKNENKDLH